MKYIVSNRHNDKTSSHRSLIAAKKAAEKIFQCSLFETHRDICESLRLNDSVTVTPILCFDDCVFIDRIN